MTEGGWTKVPFDRGIRLSVSFSCPEEMFGAITDVRQEERCNMSQAIQHLIRMGLVYKKMLQEQREFKAKESAKRPTKKKPKPKTPSKKG